MDKAKEVARNGWHPKGKDGGKESWRGDFKGINSVATKLGHGKNKNFENAINHTSRPLSSLKDPDSFGPPPKNLNYHGGAAVPHSITPDRRGLGAPLSADEIRAKEQREQEAQAEQSKPAPPPVPYRANRTGINPASLPKPPVRRIEDGEAASQSTVPVKPPKPNPPPRLPPRQNSHPLQSAPCDPPPPYSAEPPAHNQSTPTSSQNGFVNRGALDRLGAAGVSVPGLGIGRTSSQEGNTAQAGQANAGRNNSPSPVVSSLQSRFANLSTSGGGASNSPPVSSPTEGSGTTFAQKQAALRTASNFRNDPSSVSLADARATAATANNFRERHGEQVAQGWKIGAGLNQKYGIADKVEAAAGNTSRSPPPVPTASVSSPPPIGGAGSSGGINRKPPPPPVPMGSKPR